MVPFNVEFFSRNLVFKHRDVVGNLYIDDDYISAITNSFEISSTNNIDSGDFLHITGENVDFFGLVSNVTPGEYVTKVSFKPFITVFDEPFVFNTTRQGTDDTISHPTLEATIKGYIDWFYSAELPNRDPDTLQKMPIDVTIVPQSSQQVSKWSFYYEPQIEGTTYCTISMYKDLIVPALKYYGVSVRVVPSFANKKIHLYIEHSSDIFRIDADLDNIVVKTLKYNERPNGVNKFVAYNSTNFGDSRTFYVYTDHSWSMGLATGKTRITPVVRDVQIVIPREDDELDATTAFDIAAIEAAYSALSGLQWDNLIELEVAANDPIVKPSELCIGQQTSIHYEGSEYNTILTGKTYNNNTVTLLFGSERIQYSKRTKKWGLK